MCSQSRPIGWEWSEWCGLHMRVKKNTPSGDRMPASNAMISCTPVRIGTISCVGFTLQTPLRSCDTVVWFTCCFLDCGGSMQSMVRFRRNVPSQYVSVKYVPCCTAPNNSCPFCVTPDANLFPMSSWLNHVYFNYNIKYYVKMATTSLLGIKHMLVNDSHAGCNCPHWNPTHPDNLACFWEHWPLGRQYDNLWHLFLALIHPKAICTQHNESGTQDWSKSWTAIWPPHMPYHIVTCEVMGYMVHTKKWW